MFFPDRLSNTAVLLSVAGVTETRKTPVGVRPTAGFLLDEDRYGITLNAEARTASVIDLLDDGGEEHAPRAPRGCR